MKPSAAFVLSVLREHPEGVSVLETAVPEVACKSPFVVRPE